MRVYSVILVCCVVGIQVTRTQNRRFFFNNGRNAVLRSGGSDSTTMLIEHLILHGVTGELPKSYKPLTKADEHASMALTAAAPSLIHQLPNTYTVKEIGPVNIEIPDYGISGKLYLNNLVLKGVNQVQMRHIEVRLKNGRVDFLVYAPLSATGNFEFNGQVGDTPLHLTGSVSVGVQDIHPVGAVHAKKVTLPDAGEVYQVDNGQVFVEVHNVAVTLKKSNTGNLDINEEFVRKIMARKTLTDKIAEAALISVFKGVNKILATIPAWKIDLIFKS